MKKIVLLFIILLFLVSVTYPSCCDSDGTNQEAYKSSLTFDTWLDDSTEWVYYDCYVSIYPQIFIF